MYDTLVKSIFDSLNDQHASPEQKRVAAVRAGLIAQAYAQDADLLFKQDCDVNDSPDAAGNSATA